MAWGMVWGLSPLLSSCLLIQVKDFSGKTVTKDVVVNHGRSGWSRGFNLLLFKRKQANCSYWAWTTTETWHKSTLQTLALNLLRLSWYKMAHHGHLDPAWIGNACLTLLPCSALVYECLAHPGNEESQNKTSGNAASFASRAAHTHSCFYQGLSGQKTALGDTFHEMGKGHCLTKQGYRLPSIPLHWQLNKPLSHMWLCLKKLVWFRMIWVEEDIPLKDLAWASPCVEGGRGEFPSPCAKVNSAQKEETWAHCSHLRAFHQPKWKIN